MIINLFLLFFCAHFLVENQIDVLVMDLQDVGTRCFTYISTMKECLNSSKLNQVPFVILDRVNPIGAQSSDLQGKNFKNKFLDFVYNSCFLSDIN